MEHVSIRARGGHTLVITEAQQRDMARLLARVLGRRMLLYGAADNHTHTVLTGDEATIRRLVQNLQLALRRKAGLQTEPAHRTPVTSLRHLENLVRYVHMQAEHHGFGAHAALWEASSLRDILGMRLLPGFDPLAIRRALPRWNDDRFMRSVGLDPLPPLRNDPFADLSPSRLCALSAEVFAANLPLSGRQPERVAARTLAAQISAEAGWPAGRFAPHLDVHERSVMRLRRSSVPDGAREALLRRLALDELLVGGTASARPPDHAPSPRRR